MKSWNRKIVVVVQWVNGDGVAAAAAAVAMVTWASCERHRRGGLDEQGGREGAEWCGWPPNAATFNY